MGIELAYRIAVVVSIIMLLLLLMGCTCALWLLDWHGKVLRWVKQATYKAIDRTFWWMLDVIFGTNGLKGGGSDGEKRE